MQRLTLHTAEYEDETRPVDALMKGLDDLRDLCDVVEDKFVKARDEFNAQQ